MDRLISDWECTETTTSLASSTSLRLHHTDHRRRHNRRRLDLPGQARSINTVLTVASSVSRSMESSPFAKLSPELRNEIYELALRSNRTTLELRDMKNYNGLTQTCRQIRTECQAMLYALNNFAFTTSNRRLAKFCAFLEALGPTVIPQLRSLRLLIIERVPCRGAPLQCSQNIEICGSETAEVKLELTAKYHPINPRGVEAVLYETLVKMGVQVRGRGSTWYTTATWYVGAWSEAEHNPTGTHWLRVT